MWNHHFQLVNAFIFYLDLTYLSIPIMLIILHLLPTKRCEITTYLKLAAKLFMWMKRILKGSLIWPILQHCV